MGQLRQDADLFASRDAGAGDQQKSNSVRIRGNARTGRTPGSGFSMVRTWRPGVLALNRTALCSSPRTGGPGSGRESRAMRSKSALTTLSSPSSTWMKTPFWCSSTPLTSARSRRSARRDAFPHLCHRPTPGELKRSRASALARSALSLTLSRRRERGPDFLLPLPSAGEGRGEGRPCERRATSTSPRCRRSAAALRRP